MRTPSGLLFLFLTLLVAVWCVMLPLFWAYNISQRVHIEYWEMLSFYVPDLAVGGLVLACLPGVLLRHRYAVIGLLLAATLLPLLVAIFGSPDNGWPVTVMLLSWLGWRLHVQIARRA